jgi:serine/threonine protein kinase
MAVAVDPRIGTEPAGYRIDALLGRGGMGVVYLAEQLRLKRRVALKLLAPQLAGDVQFRERFLRESELAASLDHPNVLPVFDAGEAEGALYIAMRYVEGTDLGRVLRSQKYRAGTDYDSPDCYDGGPSTSIPRAHAGPDPSGIAAAQPALISPAPLTSVSTSSGSPV